MFVYTSMIIEVNFDFKKIFEKISIKKKSYNLQSEKHVTVCVKKGGEGWRGEGWREENIILDLGKELAWVKEGEKVGGWPVRN